MRAFKIILAILFVIALGSAIYYVVSSNKKEVKEYKTEKPKSQFLSNKIVATGKLVPEEEIEIKPNISGVLEKLYVKEGDRVSVGQLIATVKVVPNVDALNAAREQMNTAKINLTAETQNYKRQKSLYNQGVIAKAEYERALQSYNNAKQNVDQARRSYQLAQTGVAPGLEGYATTQIRSTINGMVLDIPVEEGVTVQQINNFSVGTTIATIADVSKMIFEGKVDEAETGKLEIGTPMKITIGALPDEELDATLTFISPKGEEENGTIKFEIKAEIDLTGGKFIRSGYSANAEIETTSKRKVLTIKEALIQYDEQNKPFVEVKQSDGEYKKQEIKLGNLSDNVYIEVKDGITIDDDIKVPQAPEEEGEKK